MDVVEAVIRLGGMADAADLVALTSRRRLRTAVDRGDLVRHARGRYTLANVGGATAAAARLSGAVSHLHAALHWGWEVKTIPSMPHVTVPAKRRLPAGRRDGVVLHWKDLADADVVGGFTSRRRTALDCARDLPFDEALAVLDSALRHGMRREQLLEAAAELRGPGAGRARRVIQYADRRAANPFESVLRAIAIEQGLDVVPQLAIDTGHMTYRPDLADQGRLLILEADSWRHHAGHFEHDNDCVRYNTFVALGWRVLRFTWPQVMHDPAYVRRILRWVLDERPPGQEQRSSGRRVAS